MSSDDMGGQISLLEQAFKIICSIAEDVYADDLERLMACQDAIDDCMKKEPITHENAKAIHIELFMLLKLSFPQVMARINQIVDGRDPF